MQEIVYFMGSLLTVALAILIGFIIGGISVSAYYRRKERAVYFKAPKNVGEFRVDQRV